MLIFNGKKYAKSDKEFTKSLFQRDGTANGYYKRLKRGIKLYNIQRELIAFIKAPSNGDNAFVVSASIKEGKPRYMFALSGLEARYLGTDNLTYMQEIEECNRLFEV